jgi:outer membrane receptor protein involved in Fe transport
MLAGVMLLSLECGAVEVRLIDLISSAREQGHQILYSSDLVHSGMRVEGGEGGLESLQAALPAVGLQLIREGDAWLIRPGPLVSDNDSRTEGNTSRRKPENLIVTGTRHQFPEDSGSASARRLAAAELANAPNLASDLMRSTLRLPGISSVGISAKPYIRGGLKDELLILQDGIELLEPFHLADYHSAYSTLDYHTVEAVDFYTGGFPSRYGNRMSGVMDISNDWSDPDYHSNLGVSSFAAFINTRNSLPGNRDGSWALSYRRGDLSDLTDYIESRSGDPEYQDGSARLDLGIGGTARLNAGLVYSEDDIKFADLGESASSRIDSWYGWVQLEHRFTEQLQTRISLSAVDFQREKTQSNAELEDIPEDPGSFLDYDQEVRRLSLRNDYHWLRAGVLHEFGWQLEAGDASYDNVSVIDRGDLADIIGTERDVHRDIHLDTDGWSGGLYWAGEWELGDGWLVQPGIRWDWQDYYVERGSDSQFSPRLGLAFSASEHTLWRLSVGRFYQPEGIQELQVLDGVQTFYEPQRSDQVVAGVEWSDRGWQVILEAYFKRYEDTKGRFENIFNPFVLLPEMESDRLGLFPEEARAYGLDVDLAYDVTPGLRAGLRYSYMHAEDKLEGEWIDRRWSQRHTANASLIWQQDNFSLAVALLWHSGWRSTQLPAFIPDEAPINVLDYLNNRELREYLSIDISARYSWDLPRARLQIYADISNVTDRSNQAGVDFDEEEVDGGYTLTPDRETLLELVPSVGVTLSF